MKKSLCMLLTLVLLLGLAPLTAASSEQAGQTITYLFSAGTSPDANNPVLQALEERIGVRVEATMAATGDYAAKLNTLIASRQLPDLFSVGAADAIAFKGEGMLAELNDLVAGYGPNLERELGPVYRQSPANADGLYLLSGAGAVYRENLCVRVDWLKNLNLEMPTDLDSLYDVLYAFTYNDPDGNGQDDTVGIVMTMTQPNQWDVLFGAFGVPYERPYQLEDGTITTYMKAPGYLEAIDYLRKLYQAAVMDTEFATMPAMTAHERLWTGRCGVYGFRAVGTTNNWYPGRYTFEVPEDPTEVFGYTDITGPNGHHGCTQAYRNVSGGFVVASTAKYPEACVKFLDYMATPEGDELMYLGVEGLMYEWVDKENGKYQRLGAFTDDALHRANGGFTYWMGIPEENAELRTMNKLTQDAQAFARDNSFDYPYIYTPFEAQSEYGAALADIVKEALAQLIVTTGDVQAEYDAFVARWEAEGGLEWEAGATEAYASQEN